MAITLNLTTEQEAQLKELAKAGGSDVNGYCQKLVEVRFDFTISHFVIKQITSETRR